MGRHVGILDVMMPGLDGIQVCRALREHKNLRGLAISFFSLQKAIRKILSEDLREGADDYIVKPFDLKELRARIRVGVTSPRLSNHD